MSETEELIEGLKAVSTGRDTLCAASLAKSAVNSAMAFLCRVDRRYDVEDVSSPSGRRSSPWSRHWASSPPCGRRSSRAPMPQVKVNSDIAGWPYQVTAVTRLCEWFNAKHRRGLLVMATGTGMTHNRLIALRIPRRLKNVLK